MKLIPPQHVKAFLIGNKNDYNDAFAITVAAKQPHIKCVGVNFVEQQDNQAQHKARALAIGQRTSLCNQTRGLLAEYGVSPNTFNVVSCFLAKFKRFHHITNFRYQVQRLNPSLRNFQSSGFFQQVRA